MSRKNDYSKNIIKILAEKPAVSIENLEVGLPDIFGSRTSKSRYAITRSIKGLEEAGLIEQIHSGQGEYARLTKDGKKKAHSLKLDGDGAIIDPSWDGFWRLIILDLPEDRKAEREALRYLLKKAGFICIKNSVWISMYPFEHLFTNIKKDLELSTEMMIIVTNKIDEDTEQEFLKLIQK